MVSPVVYVGGKHRLREWVVERMPHVEDAETYVELFLGAGHIFFELHRRDRERSVRRTYVLNDRDGEVCNFFRVLRNRPRRLKGLLMNTPYCRREYLAAWSDRCGAVERARRFFIRLRQGMGGRLTGRPGWGIARTDGRGRVATWRAMTQQIDAFADPLRDAYIDGRDFAQVIAQWNGPNVLFYADPPYLGCQDDYPTAFGSQDHQRLAEAMASAKGWAAVSGYDGPLMRRLFPRSAWRRHTCEVAVTSYLAAGAVRRRATECLLVRRF